MPMPLPVPSTLSMFVSIPRARMQYHDSRIWTKSHSILCAGGKGEAAEGGASHRGAVHGQDGCSQHYDGWREDQGVRQHLLPDPVPIGAVRRVGGHSLWQRGHPRCPALAI